MPAHNEQDYLEAAVVEVVTGLRARSRPFEMLVCENGSSDRTSDVAARLVQRFTEVRALSSPEADYGRALRAGFLAAHGDVVVNFDVDFIDLDFLDAALARMDGPERPVAVVASKRGLGAHDGR